MPTDTPSTLVWRESTRSYEGLEAETPFGAFYRIENLDPPGWDAYFDAPDTLKDGAGVLLAEHLPDLPSARAACEADFAARMRAAGWVPAGESERLRGALSLVAAILQSEMTRSGGKPFTGTWYIPALGIRSTVSEALDTADVALSALLPKPAHEEQADAD